MDTGSRYKTSRSETKDFFTHSTTEQSAKPANSGWFSLTFKSERNHTVKDLCGFCAHNGFGVWLRNPELRKSHSFKWATSKSANLALERVNIFIILDSKLWSIGKHHLYLPRSFNIQTSLKKLSTAKASANKICRNVRDPWRTVYQQYPSPVSTQY